MAEKKELNPSPKFPSGVKPELSPNPNQVDGLVNKTGEKPNTQFVNLPKEQEKRCLTVSEVIALIQKYAPKGDTLPDVTALDNEKVLEVIAGAWAKGRKKVNVIDAPSSTTLTDEEIDAYKGGVFNNGVFLGMNNPVFFPSNLREPINALRGISICRTENSIFSYIRSYLINLTTKEISYDDGLKIEFNHNTNTLDIQAANVNIKGRSKPQIEVALTNLGTITSTETATGSGFYKNEIPYTDGIGNEDVINVKMSNGAVYQAINDTTNSKLVIYTGVDFATNSVTVSKCWKLAY